MMIALRQGAPVQDLYRNAGTETTCTLDELRAAVGAAGLAVEVGAGELRLRRGNERLRVAISDPQRVTLASLDVFQSGCESLEYELALALVPIFGPIQLVDANFGASAIDGSRDPAALMAERRERLKAIARAISEDMAEKKTVYSRLGVRR